MAGDFKTVSHIHYAKIPALNQQPDDHFDSIFKMIFTLNPTVIVDKEIWMVQNQTTPRTTTSLGLNFVERTANGPKKSNFFEILAFAGGLWFFMSQLVVGPLSRKYFSAPVEEYTEAQRQSVVSSNVDTSGHASAQKFNPVNEVNDSPVVMNQ